MDLENASGYNDRMNPLQLGMIRLDKPLYEGFVECYQQQVKAKNAPLLVRVHEDSSDAASYYSGYLLHADEEGWTLEIINEDGQLSGYVYFKAHLLLAYGTPGEYDKLQERFASRRSERPLRQPDLPVGLLPLLKALIETQEVVSVETDDLSVQGVILESGEHCVAVQRIHDNGRVRDIIVLEISSIVRIKWRGILHEGLSWLYMNVNQSPELPSPFA